MKDIKFNEWQEMALKKDMETIIKKLSNQEPIIFSLCWEIVIAIGTIIVDHLFDIKNFNIPACICIASLAIIPPLVILVYKICKWVASIKKVRLGIYDVKYMVDMFDNQICYWVMMCNSYSNLLSNIEKKNEKIFLYQEGCYYNNKSMQALYHMKPVIDKVFSDNKEKIIKNNLVAVYRLIGLLDMMKQYQMDLDNCIREIENDTIIQEQINVNEAYQKKLSVFVNDVNKQFNKQFIWN